MFDTEIVEQFQCQTLFNNFRDDEGSDVDEEEEDVDNEVDDEEREGDGTNKSSAVVDEVSDLFAHVRL